MVDLKGLARTAAHRFKIPEDLKGKVLPKYPKEQNVIRGTFSCSLKELDRLQKGEYDYLIYSTGEKAYLFDAKLFIGKLNHVEYVDKRGFPQTTKVGYVRTLIDQKQFIQELSLVEGENHG